MENEFREFYMYEITDIFKESDFESEKIFCDYIESNIFNICKDLSIDIHSFERESYIERKRFPQNKVGRIDFFIKENNGNYVLLEVKNPTHLNNELRSGIGQMLEYICCAERNEKKVSRSILMTTRIDEKIIEIIERFKLPIEVVLLSKSNISFWKRKNE